MATVGHVVVRVCEAAMSLLQLKIAVVVHYSPDLNIRGNVTARSRSLMR